jgi:hypothetical protein
LRLRVRQLSVFFFGFGLRGFRLCLRDFGLRLRRFGLRLRAGGVSDGIHQLRARRVHGVFMSGAFIAITVALKFGRGQFGACSFQRVMRRHGLCLRL